jgi:hypothetical protein
MKTARSVGPFPLFESDARFTRLTSSPVLHHRFARHGTKLQRSVTSVCCGIWALT